MPLKLFEFLKQLMIDTFLIKKTQLRKLDKYGKFLFRWEIR